MEMEDVPLDNESKLEQIAGEQIYRKISEL